MITLILSDWKTPVIGRVTARSTLVHSDNSENNTRLYALDHPGSQVELHNSTQDAQLVEALVSTDWSRPPVNPQRTECSLWDNKEKIIQRKIKERSIKQLPPLKALFENATKYHAYFVMKFSGIDIDSNLNVIAADKDIEIKIGRAKKITKLSRDSLLMIANSEDQSKIMTAIKTDNVNPGIVQPHRTMNCVQCDPHKEHYWWNYVKTCWLWGQHGKVFYGQEPPSGESTTTACGVGSIINCLQ